MILKISEFDIILIVSNMLAFWMVDFNVGGVGSSELALHNV